MIDLSTLWNDTRIMLEDTLPPEAKCWLDDINIKDIDNGTVTLAVTSDFVTSVMNEHKAVIENFISEKAEMNLRVSFVVDEGAVKSEPVNRIVRKEEVVKEKNEERKTVKEKRRNPTLNPRYSLDNFIKGDNSDIAYKAAQVIALNPGTSAFNPCLIYGGVGLGKTHLLQAIGNFITEKYPAMNVIYVTAENFTNEFISNLNNISAFKKKYRDADVLLIDDIHFLQKKDATQEELFYTFEELYHNNKQIVFTCDRPINELTDITDRLKTRFSSGLNVDLRPPEYEVRLAIARQKNKEEKLGLDDNVLDYISETVKTNVRDLEGALLTVSGISKLVGTPATVEMARNKIKGFIVDTPAVNVDFTIGDVFTATANYFNVSLVDMRGTSRRRNIQLPRQIAMYVAYNCGHFTQSDIGKYVNKDHTSVRYSVNQTESQKEADDSIRKAINDVTKMLGRKEK